MIAVTPKADKETVIEKLNTFFNEHVSTEKKFTDAVLDQFGKNLLWEIFSNHGIGVAVNVDGNFISWNYPLDATNFERYQSYIESRKQSFTRMEKYAILRLRCPTIHDYYAYMLVKKWGDKFYPLVTIDPLKYHDGQYTVKFDHSIHDTSRHTTRELFDVFFNFIRIKLNPPQ